MATETEICNLALSHLGVGKEISSLETDRSQEAAACRRFYEQSRDQTLRDFVWPFAKRYTDLTLYETDPAGDEWGYSYRYPANCLKIRRILSGIRNDNSDSRIPYEVLGDDAGLLIYTDKEDAVIEYTARVTDVLRYPADFIMALSLRLAAYIAPTITARDEYKLGQRALQLYQYEIGIARASALGEQAQEKVPESDLIRARE